MKKEKQKQKRYRKLHFMGVLQNRRSILIRTYKHYNFYIQWEQKQSVTGTRTIKLEIYGSGWNVFLAWSWELVTGWYFSTALGADGSFLVTARRRRGWITQGGLPPVVHSLLTRASDVLIKEVLSHNKQSCAWKCCHPYWYGDCGNLYLLGYLPT